MTNAEQINAVREAGFGGYGKVLHSICNRPEWYGVERVAEAQAAIAEEPPKTPRRDKHKHKCRISCRMPKSEYNQFKRAFAASEEKTIQDFLRRIVREHIQNAEC